MPHLSGLATKKNVQGETTQVTIDLKNHKKIILPVLGQTDNVTKSKFMQERENCISISESRKEVHAKIQKLWKK